MVPEAEIPISIEVILQAPVDQQIYQKPSLKALEISIISAKRFAFSNRNLPLLRTSIAGLDRATKRSAYCPLGQG